MMTLSKIFIVVFVAVIPAPTFAGEARVKVQDGLVSATFDATPSADAFDAIRRVTGVEVILPPRGSEKPLTLAVEPMPFQQFLEGVLQALDVGGFALVYAPGGRADRLIIVDKGTESKLPIALSAAKPNSSSNESPGRTSVPFLISRSEAESMKLGTPGQMIVVQSAPFGKVQTSGCDGSNAHYPVQTVLVTGAANTYVTSIIACAPGGLNVGDSLTPGPVPTGTQLEGNAAHSRFMATSH